jgi:replicative DNA helicase
MTADVVVPQNLGAERSVLGALLLAGSLGPDESAAVLTRVREEGLTAAHFYYVERHGFVFEAIEALVARGDPTDALFVAEQLRCEDRLEAVDGERGIVELFALASSTRNAGHHARLVVEWARRREVLKLGVSLARAARNGGLDQAEARASLERVLATLDEARTAETQRRLVAGDEFVLDRPREIRPVWAGASGSVVWAEGEPFMLYGPDGVGKTALGQQLALGRIGLRARVLGMRVAEDERGLLYLALDRPEQAARSFARMATEADRERLRERLIVWRGPVPFDVVKTPRALVEFARTQGAGTVVIDSLKDLAPKLSEDEVGGMVNSAIQELVALDIEVLVLHHPRKRQQGAGPPKKLEDVYGSRWLTAGMGSVCCLWGEAGDLVIELSHLKQPAEQIGPLKLLHDHERGVTTILESVDLLALVRAASTSGLTAEAAAVRLFDTETPDRNAIEKARRRLKKLAEGGYIGKRGEKPNPVTYHPRGDS